MAITTVHDYTWIFGAMVGASDKYMIYSKFSITNPWSKDNFKSVWSTSGQATTNKAWELEIISSSCYLLHAELEISVRGKDHAGGGIELGLFGFVVSFRFYDCRHWDYNKNQWADPYDTSNNWN